MLLAVLFRDGGDCLELIGRQGHPCRKITFRHEVVTLLDDANYASIQAGSRCDARAFRGRSPRRASLPKDALRFTHGLLLVLLLTPSCPPTGTAQTEHHRVPRANVARPCSSVRAVTQRPERPNGREANLPMPTLGAGAWTPVPR